MYEILIEYSNSNTVELKNPNCVQRQYTIPMLEKRLESVTCIDKCLIFSSYEFICRKTFEYSFRSRFDCIQLVIHFHHDLHVLKLVLNSVYSVFSFSVSLRTLSTVFQRTLAPHTTFEASLAGIVLATRIPTRGKSYRDTRCASEICDRVNDAGTAAI